MNLKPKQILRQLNQLSQVEPKNEAAGRALANARAKLAGLATDPARSLPSQRNLSFLRSRHMVPRVAALVLACAAFAAIIVVFSMSGGHGQLAFAQVIEKVQQTQSVVSKTRYKGPDGKEVETCIILLPDGRIRTDSPQAYSIQDAKAGKMIIVDKENKKAHLFEGFAPPGPAISNVNVYEKMRNLRKEAGERLPDEQIGNRKTLVFRVEMKELPKMGQTPTWKVWVDQKTELPIRLECTADDENGKKIKQVMYDIEFDRPLDPSLFSFKPPEGYTVQTSGITNFPDSPDKAELRAPEIMPGVGLGPIRFGMSREKIESLLGKPDGYEANQTSLLYNSRGFVLSVSHRSGLKNINCISQMLTMARVRDFAGKTKEGIGIGSSLQEVEKVFGKPDRDEGHDSFNKRLVYEKFGLEIQFVDDKVIIIYMSEARPEQGRTLEKNKNSPKKQEPKTAGRPLKINVVGPEGKPVAGVKIRDGIWSKEMTAKTNSDHVCDAQGQTVIELPKTFDILRLFTSCDGYVPQFVHWEQLDENPPDTYTIKLTKGTLIGGNVKSEEGQPIVGAKVEVMLVRDPRESSQRTSFTSWLAEGNDAKTTDAAGNWTLDNVPQGKVKLMLKITHPDYISDADWGVLQKEQKITLEDLRQQKATVIMHPKK